MTNFTITLANSNDDADHIVGADAYQQEGPLTTFFSLGSDRQVIDSWSTRLASFRTTDIVSIRRSEKSLTVTTVTDPPELVAV